MKHEKLTYDKNMEKMIDEVVQQFKGLAMVDTRYIQFHNHICPNCRRKMIDRKSNQVKGASISLFWPHSLRNVVIPYSLCKRCFKRANQIKKEMVYEQNQLMDYYIFKQVNAEYKN